MKRLKARIPGLIRGRTRRFLGDETGGATMEFMVVFPTLMFMVFAFIEVGYLGTRAMMLERGLDIASRDLRLGITNDLDHDKFRDLICDSSSLLLNCKRDLIVEVVQYDPASAYPQNQANCIDRSGDLAPQKDFNPGVRKDIMFVRACMIVDPIIPGVGIGLKLPTDSTGGYQLVSYTAFMNEP